MRLPAASEFALAAEGATGPSGWQRPTARRRAAAIGLTLIAELLFLVVLLGLSPKLPIKILPTPSEVTLDIRPEAKAPEQKRERALQAKAAPQRPKQTIVQPRPVVPPARLPVVPMSAEELAASDISKLGSKAAGTGNASAAVGPGEGPGGAHLYKADWVREPTNAELDYYLPKVVDRGSWAVIACQTIAHYHVENCYALGESPLGSGLARGMRLASWQFLVHPPNIDGKPLVGSWVRIRIDFTEGAEKAEAEK